MCAVTYMNFENTVSSKRSQFVRYNTLYYPIYIKYTDSHIYRDRK